MPAVASNPSDRSRSTGLAAVREMRGRVFAREVDRADALSCAFHPGGKGPGDGEERSFRLLLGGGGPRAQDDVRTACHRLRGGQSRHHAGGPGGRIGLHDGRFFETVIEQRAVFRRVRLGADDRFAAQNRRPE